MTISSNPHVQSLTNAAIKSAPALAPAVGTGMANMLDLIETSLSILLLVLSIAFLVWRWRAAYNREESDKP